MDTHPEAKVILKQEQQLQQDQQETIKTDLPLPIGQLDEQSKVRTEQLEVKDHEHQLGKKQLCPIALRSNQGSQRKPLI